jgi:photosystem II stability/assembly factor-like uncharacterized protein
MSSSEGANTGTITPGYAYDADSNRDASDWTKQLKEKRIYYSYTDNNFDNKKTTDPWFKYGNEFRLSYLAGRFKCDTCTGNAFGGGGVPLSKDVAESWTFSEATTAGSRSWRGVDSSSDGTKLVGVVGSGGRIYTSTDSGSTWTVRGVAGAWVGVASNYNNLIIAAVDRNPSAEGQGIYVSIDSGATWNKRETSRLWSAIACSNDSTTPTLCAVVNSGRIYVSLDNGNNWTSQTNIDRAWSAVALGYSTGVAVVNGGGIHYSEDTTSDSWNEVNNQNRAYSGVACSDNGDILVAVVNGGYIYTSSDSGTNWTQRAISAAWSSVSCSSDGEIMQATVNGGQVYTSFDYGENWTPTDSSRSWSCVAVSQNGLKSIAGVNSGNLYVGSYNAPYVYKY